MQREINVVGERRLELTYQGPVSVWDRIEALDIVRLRITNASIRCVLIDYTHAWVSISDASSLTALQQRLLEQDCLRGVRMALVCPPAFHALPTEDLAAIVGFEVQRFYSRPAAVAWLKRDLLAPDGLVPAH